MGERRRRTMGQRGAPRDVLSGHGSSCMCAACRAERWSLAEDRAQPRQRYEPGLPIAVVPPCDGCDSIMCTECSNRRTDSRLNRQLTAEPLDYSYGRYHPVGQQSPAENRKSEKQQEPAGGKSLWQQILGWFS